MTIFQKILDGEIPCSRVFEDDQCLAFRDVAPAAPVHVLVIPKRAIARVDEAKESDEALLGHMMRVASQVAHQEGLEDFRLVVNCGEKAGQSVFHMHIHVLGGRDMTWPPG